MDIQKARFLIREAIAEVDKRHGRSPGSVMFDLIEGKDGRYAISFISIMPDDQAQPIMAEYAEAGQRALEEATEPVRRRMRRRPRVTNF